MYTYVLRMDVIKEPKTYGRYQPNLGVYHNKKRVMEHYRSVIEDRLKREGNQLINTWTAHKDTEKHELQTMPYVQILRATIRGTDYEEEVIIEKWKKRD